nr:S8 family peptidase [Bacteroidota bacterium]
MTKSFTQIGTLAGMLRSASFAEMLRTSVFLSKTIWSFTALLMLLGTAGVFAQSVQQGYVDGEIYLKLKSEVPFSFDANQSTVDINAKMAFLNPLVAKYKITKAEASFYFSRSEILKRTFRIYFDNSKSVEQFLEDVSRLSQVEYAEKIPYNSIEFTPNDIKPNALGTANGQYGLYNIKAKEAWDLAKGSASTVVAIVDNAIEITHSDLAANISSSRDVSDGDNNPAPPTLAHNHGTHTSGIACARTNNGNGIASIGYGCGIMAIKATRNTSGTTSIDNGYEGIAWAATHGAKIISCSWGGSGSSITNQNVVNDAYFNNAIVVASAGNNNTATIQYPAGYNHVLSVANVNMTDHKSGTSTYGTWVDVSAPGDNIYSSLPGNTYGVKSGTSMAAPMVAGLCGLVRSINPALTYDEVVNIVKNTADNINALNPSYVGKLGSGRINAFNAIKCALPCSAKIPTGLSITKSVPNITFKWNASSCVEGYNLYYRIQGSWLWTSVNVTKNSYTASLQLFANYEWKVRTKCSSVPLTYSSFSPTFSFFVLKTGDNNFENVIENESIQLMMFPNPAENVINLNVVSAENNFNIQILNVEGKIVRQQQLVKDDTIIETPIDISTLPSGIYMVRVEGQSNTVIQRFVKN